MRVITHCPACQTQFFATEEQLNKHGGKVRCGQCMHIFDAKSQLLQQASEVEKFFKESEYAGEFSDDIIPATRAEVIPPPPPEKTRFNPDKIVDIITFIEHPYFCNLKPYPWQKLILKCFYMGQEGNTNLVINEKKEESGCNGCVWNYVKENEDLFYKTRKNQKQINIGIPIFF